MRLKNILCFSLIIVFITGCSSTQTNNKMRPSGIVSTTESPYMKAPYADPTVASSTAETTSEVTTKATVLETEAPLSIEQTVIYDQDNITITVTGISEDYLGPQLKLLIENNTDKNLTFQSRNTSINNYMVNSIMSASVASGKKINTTMDFYYSELEELGIEEICDIEFSIYMFDTDTWKDNSETDMFKVSTTSSYEQEYDDSGTVIYEKDGIKIVYKGIGSDYLGPTLLLYVENNTENNITITTRDLSINGFMINGICSLDVASGKKALGDISFLSDELKKNSITQIDDVELHFHIYNSDDMLDYIDTGVITIKNN